MGEKESWRRAPCRSRKIEWPLIGAQETPSFAPAPRSLANQLDGFLACSAFFNPAQAEEPRRITSIKAIRIMAHIEPGEKTTRKMSAMRCSDDVAGQRRVCIRDANSRTTHFGTAHEFRDSELQTKDGRERPQAPH